MGSRKGCSKMSEGWRLWFVAACAALACGTAAAAAAAAETVAATPPQGVAWLKDFPSTLKQAAEGGKLIMVDFFTTWCVYCKRLDREAFVDPRVVELSRGFAAARLDADVHKAASMRYRPEGFPTIVFATGTGEEILRVSGYKTADQIYSVMKSVTEIGPKVAELKGRLAKDRKDWTAHEELGRIYLQNELWTQACEHLELALKSLPASEKRAAAPGAECAEARIQLAVALASAGDGDHKKASRIMQKLIDQNPQGARLRDYYVELERIYTAWEKPAEAEQVRSRRLREFPEGGAS